MDDQRSAWDPLGRLARIEERLERLQETVGKLKALLQARAELGEPTRRGGWGALAFSEWSTAPGPSDVSFAPAARPMSKPPCDQDPIGCVEIGIERLAEDIRGLFRVLDEPVPDDGPWLIPPGYRSPRAPQQGPPSGGQTDSGTGDDAVSGLDPTKGPGGSGPYKKKRVNPDDEDPGVGF